MALAHGLQACWSTPISSTAGKVLGAFAIYYDQPRTPTTCEQRLIEQFTHIASIAVERAQNDAALKRSEAFLAEAQRLSSTGSFSHFLATDEITWSGELYRIFELDEAVPLTKELISSRFDPEDAPFVREMIERARDGDLVEFEREFRLQMPNGSVKYVHTRGSGRDGAPTLGRGTRQGPIGARTRGQGHEPRSIDGVDRPRSQPAAVGHHYQRQHLSADVGRGSSKR
jgi:PAS domain-containing protein